MRNRLVAGNEAKQLGGGVSMWVNTGAKQRMVNCTIVGNAGGSGAGGIHSHASSPIVTRTIIAFSTEGAGLVGTDTDHCVIFGNAGGDRFSDKTLENLYIDPLFCDMANWDLTLCSNSPCLPGAPENTWDELVGAYESGCGNCDSPVEVGSWGSIKAMYRCAQ